MKRALWFASLVLTSLAFSPASSQPENSEQNPLWSCPSSDPMELARLVDRVGDARITEVLMHRDASASLRTLAIRASIHLHRPERALAPLIEMAAGRDPRLAPEAAWAVRAIAVRLNSDELARREAILSPIMDSRRDLQALVEDASAAPFIRRWADEALVALEQVGARP